MFWPHSSEVDAWWAPGIQLWSTHHSMLVKVIRVADHMQNPHGWHTTAPWSGRNSMLTANCCHPICLVLPIYPIFKLPFAHSYSPPRYTKLSQQLSPVITVIACLCHSPSNTFCTAHYQTSSASHIWKKWGVRGYGVLMALLGVHWLIITLLLGDLVPSILGNRYASIVASWIMVLHYFFIL